MKKSKSHEKIHDFLMIINVGLAADRQ